MQMFSFIKIWLKTIIFQTNYFIEILNSKISHFMMGYEMSLEKKLFY